MKLLGISYNTNNFSIFYLGYANSVINTSGYEVKEGIDVVNYYDYITDGIDYIYASNNVPI